MSELRVLLTNDDGIESPGLQALYDELNEIAAVTAVAPAENQSGVGRSRSGIGHSEPAVDVREHALGYAVSGTPADCAAFGLRSLPNIGFDLVVSGCNVGPNVGSYILGHSGTVGAAVEAAFLGVPAIAVSAYDPETFFPEDGEFVAAAETTRTVVEQALDQGVYETADVLNLNVRADARTPLRPTQPLADYDTTVETNGDARAAFENSYWAANSVGPDGIPDFETYRDAYPAWSDRAAIVNGEGSLTALSVPQTPLSTEIVEPIVTAHNGQV